MSASVRECARAHTGRLRHGRGAPRMYALPERCYLARCVIAEREEALRVTPRGRPLVDGLPRVSINRKYAHKIKDFSESNRSFDSGAIFLPRPSHYLSRNVGEVSVYAF